MSLSDTLHEYYKYGNLHPIQYIKRCKNTKQKLFLFTTLFTLLVLGIYLSLLQWKSYQENMVERYLDTVSHPIWNLPFPSVTICSYNLVYKKNTKDITKLL